VAVINRTMAERFWPEGDALAQRIRLLVHQKAFEIVGIVGDVSARRTDRAPDLLADRAAPEGGVQLVLRTDVPPGRLLRAVEDRIESVEPDIGMSARTMDDLVERQLTDPRFTTALFVMFAGLALVLAGHC
jgi:putative ABC transport system permease protein